MAINKFPPESVGATEQQFIPAGVAGSYATSEILTPGVYRISTDTTQNISAANFFIQSPEGFKFGAPIRGGQGYLPVPVSASVVNIAAGTFPLPINLEKAEYAVLDAPSASISDYLPASLSFNVDLPAGSPGFNVYWPNGTNASFSGSTASVAVPAAVLPDPATVQGVKIAIAARDANNVIGQTDVTTLTAQYPFIAAATAMSVNFYSSASLSYSITGPAEAIGYRIKFNNGSLVNYFSGSAASISNPTAFTFDTEVIATVYAIDSASQVSANGASFSLGKYPWIEFTSTGTFTKPVDVSSVDVYVAGGGGGSASRGPGGYSFSAGGGGGGNVIFSPAVPVSSPVTVTVGAGSTSTGGTSSFGPSVTAVGGGGSINSSGASSGSGNPGAPGISQWSGGGGGGHTSPGSSGATSPINIGGNGGAGYAGAFSVPVAGGGGGGAANVPSAGGAGVDGGAPGRPSTSAGGFPGFNASANRSGGSGGGSMTWGGGPNVGFSASTGGSGRVAVKVNYD